MRVILAAALGIAAIGCGGTSSLEPEDPYQQDPSDPVICVGDPDSQIICRKASEFWDCSQLPNGDKKCVHRDAQTPGGSVTWSCTQEGDKIICNTSTPDAPAPGGASGWTCTTGADGTSCEKQGPLPPGGGSWDCILSEFTWTCTQEGTGAPPSGNPPSGSSPLPPGSMPPGAGTEDCVTGGSTPEHGQPIDGAWAKVVTKKLSYNGVPALYVRVTFNKLFVDNCYGANSSSYYNPSGKNIGHSFDQLVESDKAEIYFNNNAGKLVMHAAVDYISPSSSAPSGYACLGVTGGEGSLPVGQVSDVLAARSSLSVNLNELGYKLLTDSPKCTADYAPDPQYPGWIYEVWYELWVKWSAFGSTGPGKVYITGIHASPSRVGANSFDVEPSPCP